MKSERMSPVRHVPNTITCLNLFCGCLSIVCTYNSILDFAAYFILAAAVFDFFDGFAARWLKAYSEMGKQLDSLADMVSFGVAPASVMYVLLLAAAKKYDLPVEIYTCGWWVAMFAYIIAVFSALRLAKFNIDARQSNSFIGLPTPANALFICSLAFVASGKQSVFTENIFFLLGVTVVFSFLLVSELPLFSLKFKSFDWKSNQVRYIFMILSAFVLIALHWAGLSVVILLYIIISIFIHFLCNRKVSDS